MKKVTSIFLVFSLVFLLCSCGAKPQTTEATTKEPAQQVDNTPQEPVYVYKNAVEDYLLPLEEFSWERLYKPEFVMVHFISAVGPHKEDPYNMKYVRDIFIEYDISVHYIIERDGTINCYIPENRVAWHAGSGEFLNDPKYTNQMNQYAIGIELVAIGSEDDMSIYMSSSEYQALDDSLKGFTDEQYESLKALVADICERNDIPLDRDHIIGHEDYSPEKTDPGELFDWNRILP